MNGIKIQIKISCNNFNPFTIQNLIEEFSIGKNDTSAPRFLAYDAPIPMHIICISMFQCGLTLSPSLSLINCALFFIVFIR